jgi:CBS domain-containing protein
MRIESIASPLPVVAESSESLATAARRMWAHEIGALPIVDRGTLVGILTERDLVTAMALGSGVNAAVAAHMTSFPATANPGEDTVAVARRMLDLGVRHMPLVDGGRVVGMLSATDMLTVVAWPERPQSNLAASA